MFKAVYRCERGLAFPLSSTSARRPGPSRPQDVLEQDAKREGQAFEVVLGGERVQADELERAVSRRQRREGSKAVSH